MATESSFFTHSLPASGDLSAAQYYAMVCNTSGQAAAAGAGVRIVGILQNKPDAAGKAASLAQLGISKAVAGAATTRGGVLKTDASGKLINQGGTGEIVAIGLTAAAADGDLITVLLLG